jgi:4-hydroxy-tetrahydrodipicolinate reductase
MGRTVIKLVHEAHDLALGAAVDAQGSAEIGRDAGQLAGLPDLGVKVTDRIEAVLEADVVVDFSLPRALPRLFDALEGKHVPLVLATTGLDDALQGRLAKLANTLPLIAAGNYSTGVAVLYHLAERASALLPEFDMEIVEMHHRHKIDAPSGTALGLLDAAARGRDQNGRALAVFDRAGHSGARGAGEIGVTSLRGGDVIGDHTLVLAGPGERLELTHRAGNRELFAHGALRAARFIVGKPEGRYSMAQVLGLNDCR